VGLDVDKDQSQELPLRQGESGGPDPKKLADALRFSLGMLLGVTDQIRQVEQLREPEPCEAKASNLLDPSFSRPWWTLLLGFGGAYLGYLTIARGKLR